MRNHFGGRIGFAASSYSLGIKSSADFARDHDFDIVQLSMDYSGLFPESLDKSARAEIRRYFEEKKIKLYFHGPSDIPLMNRHASIRDAGVGRILEMIDLAAELGGSSFIFHPGRLAFYSAGKNKIVFMEKLVPSKRLGFFEDSLNRMLDHAGGRITVCIENTHYMPAAFLEIIERLVSGRGMRLVWDIGYTDRMPSEKRARMLKFYNDNIRRVKIIHLHDITESGGHKALGTGSVNFEAYLGIIDAIEADIILEVFPERDLLKSVEYLNGLASRSRIAP